MYLEWVVMQLSSAMCHRRANLQRGSALVSLPGGHNLLGSRFSVEMQMSFTLLYKIDDTSGNIH